MGMLEEMAAKRLGDGSFITRLDAVKDAMDRATAAATQNTAYVDAMTKELERLRSALEKAAPNVGDPKLVASIAALNSAVSDLRLALEKRA